MCDRNYRSNPIVLVRRHKSRTEQKYRADFVERFGENRGFLQNLAGKLEMLPILNVETVDRVTVRMLIAILCGLVGSNGANDRHRCHSPRILMRMRPHQNVENHEKKEGVAGAVVVKT